jgi:hypothetical protein
MMQREELTIDDVLALEPCLYYKRARIKTIFAGRAVAHPRDVLDVPDELLKNPWPDRLWLLLRCLAPRDCALVAIRAARLALPFWRRRYPDDHRPALAIRAAIARLRGRSNNSETARAADAAAHASAFVADDHAAARVALAAAHAALAALAALAGADADAYAAHVVAFAARAAAFVAADAAVAADTVDTADVFAARAVAFAVRAAVGARAAYAGAAGRAGGAAASAADKYVETYRLVCEYAAKKTKQ